MFKKMGVSEARDVLKRYYSDDKEVGKYSNYCQNGVYGEREPFYKFDFQGWKLLILPPRPRDQVAEIRQKTGIKWRESASR